MTTIALQEADKQLNADAKPPTSDVLVFITATINCGETPHVSRRNPDERKQDYLRAFQSWLAMDCKADIVFCENSEADLSSFHEVANSYQSRNNVSVISFQGNRGAEKKGKGFGEVEMLRYAFTKMPELLQYRYILKVSGRYKIRNGSYLTQCLSEMTEDIVCDIHKRLTYGDTKTVAFKPRVALEHLIPHQDELDEGNGVVIEHLMAKCIHRTMAAGGTWAPLPCTPYCDGISGSWDTPLGDTFMNRFKQNLKRYLAHWIYTY